MKLTIFLLFLISSRFSFAENSKFICKFILTGPNTYPEKVLLDKIRNKKECQKMANELLSKNSDVFNKIIFLKK